MIVVIAIQFREGSMPIVAKLDEYGKGAWLAFAVLGFIVWWPLGLATLVFLFGSGRMGHGCGHERYEHRMTRLQSKMERLRERMGGGQPWGSGGGWGRGPSSGNHAFDEYRTETLRRLEEEQREFQDFLGKLRMAKDKAEFDQFMSQRRDGGEPAPSA
ncbi:DUF2852 domain-containing protein [Bosea sp. (in: a-proteobacteria)]|jgi:hypothetical protein|uniref:DUF2852 domain-containing protein n=1 Tax=Bosea sp. (in: a-proteobacteria) TaxID=1871050 RepID=UPI003F6FBE19